MFCLPPLPVGLMYFENIDRGDVNVDRGSEKWTGGSGEVLVSDSGGCVYLLECADACD